MRSARFQREREQLALRLDELIRECLPADGVPVVNEAAESMYDEFSIGKHPEQREMRFFLGDISAFTPRLVNSLRTLVANEFPKWTVVPQFDSHVFTITASAVVFGDWVVREPVCETTPAYVEWRDAARVYDAQRFGPIRRQLRYLRPRLPEILKRVGQEGFAPVGAFDFYSPRLWGGNPVVWIVVGGSLAELGIELDPATRLRSSAVAASGFVFPEYTFHFERVSDEPPAGRLLTYEFAPDDQEKLELRADDGRSLGRLAVGRILSERELGDGPAS